MKNKIKDKKKFSIVSMIITELVIIYLVIRLGDIINSTSKNISLVITRYIPVGIVIIICTFFLIQSGAKKNFKSEKDLFVKQIMIVPVIVAIVIFLFGMYSVKTNASKLTKQFEEEINKYSIMTKQYEKYTNRYSDLSKDYSKIYEEKLKEAKKTARISWVITSLVYLVCSGAITVFCLKNNIDKQLQYDEESYNIEPSGNSKVVSQIIDNDNEENLNETSERDEDNNENKEDENEAIKNIKWDL